MKDARLDYPTPCPNCGGPLVLGAGVAPPDLSGFVAIVCEKEQLTFREAPSSAPRGNP